MSEGIGRLLKRKKYAFLLPYHFNLYLLPHPFNFRQKGKIIQRLMSNKPLIIPGGIYRLTWEDNLRWVLAANEVQVLYDTWSEEEQNWTLRTHNPPALFYKSLHHNFRELSEYAGYDELTPEEINKFGLALPMAICRHRDLQWTTDTFSSMQDFKHHGKSWNLGEEAMLHIATVVLIPYDRELGMGDGIMIHAQDGNGFSEAELLWNAQNVQASIHHKIQEGIGLHRQGWIKGYPSYYIGGYYDLGDYLRMMEELKQQSL